MGKCRIMLVFLLTCNSVLCQNLPPAGLLKNVQKAVRAKCFFLVTYKKVNTTNPAGYVHTSAIHTLRSFSYMKNPMAVAVLDWTDYQQEYFSSRCTSRSLNVLAISEVDTVTFLKQLIKNNRRQESTGRKNASEGDSLSLTSNSVWILLWNWNTTKARLLDVYIPLNFRLYVVSREAGNYHVILEMYHLDPFARQLQLKFWGDWSSNSFTYPEESIFQRRSNLRGTELHVITSDNYPFTLAYDLHEDKGYRCTNKNLVGHTWRILEEELNFRSVKKNLKMRTAEEVNQYLHHHSNVIALYDSSLYWKLELEVEYLAPLFISRFQVFLRHPGLGVISSWSTYLDPFSRPLWFTLGALIVFVGFIQWGFTLCLRRFEECHVVEADLHGCLFMVYRAFCNQGQDSCPSTTCQRIVCGSTYFCAVVVLAAYSANLIASLTNQRTMLPFDDLDGLLQDRHYTLDVVEDSDADLVLEMSSDPVMKKLYQKLGARLRNRSESPSSMLAVLEEVCTQKKAVMILRDYALALSSNLSCHIIALPDFSLPASISLATSPGNVYAPFLSHSINKLRTSGMLQRLLDDARIRQLSTPDVEEPSVSLANIKCIVVVFSTGTIAAILLLFLEIIYTKRLHKKETRHKTNRLFRKRNILPTK